MKTKYLTCVAKNDFQKKKKKKKDNLSNLTAYNLFKIEYWAAASNLYKTASLGLL